MSAWREFVLFVWIAAFSCISEVCASENPIYDEINTNFIEWSNSVSVERAEAELKEFFSTFDSIEELEAWLRGKGFYIGKPRLLLPSEARRVGGGLDSTFSLVAGWDVKKNGTIFAHGLLEWLGSFFVYGVDVAVTYGGEFEIYRVSITKTSE